MLILDLDDTIFETKSMDPKLFDPAISLVKDYYTKQDQEVKLTEIISSLWRNPVDYVFQKYNAPEDLVTEFYNRIGSIDYDSMQIKPFEDYIELDKLHFSKILVTTGLEELQRAKIRALKITDDFTSIHVDDPRLKPRNTKQEIFKNILYESSLEPEQIWVIGDNPESEIIAGKQLGMNTIQRRSKSKSESEYTDHYIDSFHELENIILN